MDKLNIYPNKKLIGFFSRIIDHILEKTKKKKLILIEMFYENRNYGYIQKCQPMSNDFEVIEIPDSIALRKKIIVGY